MADKSTTRKRVKVEVRPASNILKVILIMLIVISIVTLVALRWVHNAIREETQVLTDQAAAAQAENAELTEKIGALDSVQSVKDIAQEALDLVDPDTVVIHPN